MLGVSVHQDLIHRGAVPLPLRGEGLNTAPHGEPVLHIAASEALPPGTGMPDTLWGGLEGPLRTITGADSGFRRTLCIPPRLRAAPGSGLR